MSTGVQFLRVGGEADLAVMPGKMYGPAETIGLYPSIFHHLVCAGMGCQSERQVGV